MNRMNIDKLIGHTITYTWGGKQLTGKVIRIKNDTLVVIDV